MGFGKPYWLCSPAFSLLFWSFPKKFNQLGIDGLPTDWKEWFENAQPTSLSCNFWSARLLSHCCWGFQSLGRKSIYFSYYVYQRDGDWCWFTELLSCSCFHQASWEAKTYHIAMLYCSVLWMAKYSIRWGPSIWGGQTAFGLAAAVVFEASPLLF